MCVYIFFPPVIQKRLVYFAIDSYAAVLADKARLLQVNFNRETRSDAVFAY